MTASKLHHRIPLFGRPYRQRNEARNQRDQALRERDEARQERDQALIGLFQGREIDFVRSQIEEYDGIRRQLFQPPGHFYSPIVDRKEADLHISKLELKEIVQFVPGVRIERESMVREWNALLPFLTTVPFHEERTDGFHYAFNNPNYSCGDGSMLHAMIRRHAPRKLIEIGSGWSSCCAIDTIERYRVSCRMTCIEPYPELLKQLVGKTILKLEIIEVPVQSVPLSVFEALGKGDILFIDSSHVLRTGSDVCFELFEILPRLAPGVLVHFHDMFWPFEYPRSWAIDENRSWNELYAVRAFLTNNDRWDVVFFNDYFAKLETKLIEDTYPKFLRNSGGALWLRRI